MVPSGHVRTKDKKNKKVRAGDVCIYNCIYSATSIIHAAAAAAAAAFAILLY